MKRYVKEVKGKLAVLLVMSFVLVIGMFSKVIVHEDFLYVSGSGLIDRIEPDSVIDDIKI